jgi:hypothetical protein
VLLANTAGVIKVLVILKVTLVLLHMQLHMKAVDIIKDDDMLHVGEFVSINIVSSLCFVHCGLCVESIITAQVMVCL